MEKTKRSGLSIEKHVQHAMNASETANEADPASHAVSTELEHRVLTILNVKNPLDSPDFNATEFINRLFPNEQSLASVDHVLDKLGRKTKDGRAEAERLTHAPSNFDSEGAHELQKAKDAIQDLFQKIQDIKSKAAQSEAMVQDITQDVKSLDYAKRHLTHSMTVLKRLQMLVTAVDQLETMSQNKQYKESAQLLQAVMQLMSHFKSYKSVPQIGELSERIHTLEKRLERNVIDEFEQGLDTEGRPQNQHWLLHDACLVADVLGDTTKEKIIKRFVDLQLYGYRQIFRSSEEVSQIDNISRRYGFLKRILKACDEEYSDIFPSAWAVSGRISEKFCIYTRTDIEQVLSLAQRIDVKDLLRALQLTLEFESQLSKRYEKHYKYDESDQRQPMFRFEKSISVSFQPYLWVYIEAEDKTLKSMIQSYISSDMVADEDGSIVVLPSSTDLFYFYRETLVQCARFSTGKAFWDLCQLFSKHLQNYCDEILLGGLTCTESKLGTLEYYRFASLALNTADYCCITTSQLEEKLKEKIDAEYREKIDLQSVKDAFMRTVSSCVDAMVRSLDTGSETQFQQMMRLPWSTMDTVGDQSAYVSQLQESMKRYITMIGKTVANRRYFRTFGDRFVEMFINKYLSHVLRCKPITEIGAEQMLLDTHAIKTLLTDIPLMGADQQTTVPASYGKLVSRGISKIETLLKTVMTPVDPPEGYVESYIFLIGDKSIANFTRVLELKGLKKPDQAPLIDLFQRRATQHADLLESSPVLAMIESQPSSSSLVSSNFPNALSTSLSTIATSASNFNPQTLPSFGRNALSSPFSPTLDGPASSSSLSPAGSKAGRLNENFRKLVMTGMAFRKDLQERREQNQNE
ncbi:Vps53-like protein [Radiomyces spectabilis]|uniref:Vps53-like protein n=1 Tax=Radiomyces spectabilis TaxID=64574 RepID=UPI0022203A82|nr:Vps53-like protein [Radiomyces spectabilis]KAI8370671.1 Vps53-like protein [Radiomyces spectabilis]